ncbi:hypothetical protein Ciccas_003025 [Cichlidogyrus casuarinus]|uniref:PDZ domain-containing protein n=1 Tax=Cichlidogyrus casuarinus TaxID=1844966 RepID=A0ABD2QGJ3_9PLAT
MNQCDGSKENVSDFGVAPSLYEIVKYCHMIPAYIPIDMDFLIAHRSQETASPGQLGISVYLSKFPKSQESRDLTGKTSLIKPTNGAFKPVNEFSSQGVIMIDRLVPGCPVHRLGILKPGLLILEIEGRSLLQGDMTSESAANLISFEVDRAVSVGASEIKLTLARYRTKPLLNPNVDGHLLKAHASDKKKVRERCDPDGANQSRMKNDIIMKSNTCSSGYEMNYSLN